jgi:protocatechuate 3,4-dioxygenase beta subunit
MKIFFLVLFISASLLCFGQNGVLKAKELLQSGKTVSEILTDPQFDSIRPDTEFRKLIRLHASENTLGIATASEAGAKITVKGILLNQKSQPVGNTLVYVYHTDTRGWYGADRVHFQMMEGDRGHARLFGYLLTDAQGKFQVNTIQPHGYPASDLPAHIHIEIFDDNNKAVLISELLFDDDERLQGEIRKRAENEKFYISKATTEKGKKIYNYTITLNHN